MAAKTTLTFTMQDGTSTVALTIPGGLTPDQFYNSLRVQGYLDDPDGVTTWNFSYVKKAVAS